MKRLVIRQQSDLRRLRPNDIETRLFSLESELANLRAMVEQLLRERNADDQ
jgi:hypothetical protein